MIKIIVLAMGLVALVKNPSGNSIDLLLLDTSGEAKSSYGATYPNHRGGVKILGSTGTNLELTGERYDVDAIGADQVLSQDYTKLLRMRDVLNLVENQQLVLRSECIENDFRTACLDSNNLPIVKKIISLKGEWRIGGIDVGLMEEAPPALSIVDESRFQFIQWDKEVAVLTGEGEPLWGALFLTSRVANKESITVVSGNGQLVAWDANSENCLAYLENPDPNDSCVVIRIDNRAEQPHLTLHGSSVDTRRFQIDEHFDRYYDLYSIVPVSRRLPVLTWLDVQTVSQLRGGAGVGGSIDGALRCVPVIGN